MHMQAVYKATISKMEKWAVFPKHQKTMKTFVYVYYAMLLVLGISKEDITRFFNPCKPSRMVFGMRCNMIWRNRHFLKVIKTIVNAFNND